MQTACYKSDRQSKQTLMTEEYHFALSVQNGKRHTSAQLRLPYLIWIQDTNGIIFYLG